VEVSDLTHASATLALWMGLALLAAKLGAEISERVFRQPAVVGELVAGMIIGPYALGSVGFPVIGPIFPAADNVGIGVPSSLWLIGQIAAVVLLFGAGLVTDFRTFVRFAPSATAVAVGGVVVPFVLGDLAAVVAGLAATPLDAEALFIGAILTATSVGVTARVLGDIGKLDTPEGATILGAAVIDDVIGVLVLALVVGAEGGSSGEQVDLGMLTVRTLVLWLGLTALLLVTAVPMGRGIRGLRTSGAVVGLAVAVAFIAGWIAESAGLAMIIGSYSAGLALSRSPIRRQLEPEIRVVEHVLVPVFFVTMGMVVNLEAIIPVLGFGLALVAIAGIGKVVGCGIPALLTDFRPVGALRIGVGMVPRGEVALVVAGIGLARGVIDSSLFGVAVLVAVLTTVLTPFPLVRAFRLPGDGTKRRLVRAAQAGPVHSMVLPTGLGSIYERQLLASFVFDGWVRGGTWTDTYGTRGVELRRDGQILSLVVRDETDGCHVHLESERPVEQLDSILTRAAGATARRVEAALEETRLPAGHPAPDDPPAPVADHGLGVDPRG
jgi:Kef-type K+ transport system membrane component KefB